MRPFSDIFLFARNANLPLDKTIADCFASSPAPYPSFPPQMGENSLISLLLLFPPNPLRWASAGALYCPPQVVGNRPKSAQTELGGVCSHCSRQSPTQRLTEPNRAEVACLIQFSLSRILSWQQDFFLLLFVLFIHFSTICCGDSASCAVVCGGKIRQRQDVVVVVPLKPLAAFHTPRGLDFADESAVNQ